MALKSLSIQWGPQFANTLQINDNVTYVSRAYSTFGGPTQDVVVTDTLYDAPFEVAAKLKERVFSLVVRILAEPYSAAYNTALNDLKRALYSGPIRVVVERVGVGSGKQYLTCRVEDAEELEGGDFNIKLTAADPTFTDLDGTVIFPDPIAFPDGADTGPGPNYAPINLPVYVGTAPALPIITFKVNGGGNVYQYYQTITITNPNATKTLQYYPICLDLGDISADVTAGIFQEVGTWYADQGLPLPPGVNQRYIKDIRVETLGGLRKQIFIRDSGDRGQTWHSDVKVWFVLYSLAPGETKTVRLLYGNPDANPDEVFPESSSVRPMFNMYTSAATAWAYSDFQPAWTEPQTRAMQWTPYQPGAENLTWLSYPHPIFSPPSGAGLAGVPGAGGRTQAYRPCSGAAGLQLNTPVSITRLDYNYRYGTNGKAPLVLRSQRPDQRWTEDWVDAQDKSCLLYAYQAAAAGDIVVYLRDNASPPNRTLSRAGATFTVGDGVVLQLDDGSYHRTTVTAVNAAAFYIVLQDALPGTVSAGREVQQFVYVTGQVVNYPAGDQPQTVAFVLRGDHPELTSGQWFVAGADECTVTLNSAEVPSVVLGPRVDILGSGQYQMRGRFGNTATSEYMRVNTVMSLHDKLVVDCEARECWYYAWNGSGYNAPVRRFEALTFEAVRQYWIHLDPALTTNNLSFIAETGDGGANFRNLRVQLTYRVRYF